MKRETLYKAKRADGKGWVEGNYIKVESGECYIYNRHFIPAISVPNHWFIEILPETRCQFVTEINGQRIFEGDIDTKGQVCIYSSNLAAFGFKHPNYAAITFVGQWNAKLTGRNIHDKN